MTAERSVKTLLSTKRSLESLFNIAPSYQANLTLNSKHSVAQGETLNADEKPLIRYFGVGIGGIRNIGNNLSEPNEVKPENLDLYTPIPFRIRTEDADLSPTERASYRMRARVTISGTNYIAYYLKVITLEDTAVTFSYTNSGAVYDLEPSNLNPTPPATPGQGQIQGTATEIDAYLSATAIVTGEEISEAINIIYGGNSSYARISELGLYMGHDRSIAAVDHNSQPFNYIEAINVELATHKCTIGNDISNSSAKITERLSFSSESLSLI